MAVCTIVHGSAECEPFRAGTIVTCMIVHISPSSPERRTLTRCCTAVRMPGAAGCGNFPGSVVNRARRVDGGLETPGTQDQVAAGTSRGGRRARWLKRLQQPVAGPDRCLVRP